MDDLVLETSTDGTNFESTHNTRRFVPVYSEPPPSSIYCKGPLLITKDHSDGKGKGERTVRGGTTSR